MSWDDSGGLVFRFGLFEANVDSSTLTRNGVRVRIQDQPFRTLIFLLQQHGEIVTREELRQRLWPEGTYVDFDGSLNVILKKLRAALDDNSDNPVFIETIPRRGYRFIAPVSVIPSKRDPQPDSEPGASSDSIQATPVPVPAPSVVLSRRVSLAISLVVLLAVAATWFAWRRGRQSAQGKTGFSARSKHPLRKSVAVLGFQNVLGREQDAWIGTALSEMLSTELAAGEKLRLVPGEDIVNLQMSIPLPKSDSLSKGTAARIRSSLDSDYLVTGSYAVLAGSGPRQLRVDLRLQDAQTGEILAEVAQTDDAQNLFQLVSRIGSILRDRLEVPRVGDTEQAGVLASLPLDPEAARYYSLGLAKLRAFDALGAKDLLQQAVRQDPKFCLGHAMLARAWTALGYQQNAREEAKKALDLSTDLPRAGRMLVEGDYYEALGNHEKAVSVYNALFELFPDNSDYGLQLAAAQLAGGHSSQARETLEEIKKLSPSAASDPRVDMLMAKASEDRATSLVLVRQAIQKASAHSKKLIYAQARRDECMYLLYGDHPDQGPPVCQDAYNVFMSIGNRVGAADYIRLQGDHAGYVGHFDQAGSLYQQALAILDGLGEHQKTGAILNNMAIVYENQGDLNKAESLYRQAQVHFREAGSVANEIAAIGNIADIYYERGQLAQAEKQYRQALQMDARLDPQNPGYLLYRLADLKLSQGDVKDAHQLSEQAVAAFRLHQGSIAYLTGAMLVLGETLETEGDLEGARQQFEQALAIRKQVNAMGLVAETQEELAELALEQQDSQKAEPLIRTAIAEMEKENDAPSAGAAYIQLSRALLMKGKLAEAHDAIQRAEELIRGNPDPALNLPAEIQVARIETAEAAQNSQTTASARQRLLKSIATARRLGYYRLECEARLALAKLELRTNPKLARTQLGSLAAEAQSHGLEIVARRASREIGAGTDLALN